MNKIDFYRMIEDVIEASPGRVSGDTKLNELDNWDSLSILQFIVNVDKHFGITLAAAQLSPCQVVNDLIGLLNGKVQE